jgi:PAS domain S-box-containing protein
MQSERKPKDSREPTPGARRLQVLDAERQGAEAELLDSRQRLEYLLAASPAIIYTTKVSGDYGCTYVSANLYSIMGYTPEEMTTDPKSWPARLHQEDAPRVLDECPRLVALGGGSLEYRFQHRDGHYVWIQDTFKVVCDTSGHPQELVGAWADISDRKQTRQRLEYLLAVSPAIIYTTKASGDYACTFVSDNLYSIMGYTPQEMTTDPKGWPARLHPEDACRVLDELPRLIERGGGAVEYRFQHRDGSYIWIQDTFKVICNAVGQPQELVGAWADISERKLARRRLEHLLAASPAIIYTTKASGDYTCTFVSDNLYSIMGYTPQEMTTDPKGWPARLHPDDAERVLAECERLIERGGGTLEYRFHHGAGHYVWVQDTFKVIHNDAGQPQELVGAWADISERKRAERLRLEANVQLEETKKYLVRLIESSADAIVATDGEQNVKLFNEGAESLLGYRAKDVVGRGVATLYGSEDRAREIMREMRKRGGSVTSYESSLRSKDGSDIPVLISASVLVDKDGHEIGTVGYATDLRERKKAEEALRTARDELERRVEERTRELTVARERLQYLLAVTPGIVYTTQATGEFRCTFVSENVDPIMGFSPWEMLEDAKFWSLRLHPDDAGRVFEEMTPMLERGGGTLEYRFRHRDGRYIWIQDSFRLLRDEQRRPSEIVGSWADISDRKQAEQALGERMALMNDLQNLVAASPSVIYTTQTSGAFACTFVSENLKSTMGYAPWEMREDPKFWAKRLHPDDAPRVFDEMSPLIERGGGSVEYRFRHRRGHYIWIQDSFKVIRDEQGNQKELIGSWADISDRKRVEAELKRLAEQVELRNRFIRETFGRYLNDEVVAQLLESASGAQIRGEKRKVTMMMTDLRGFTSMSERLAPEKVVALLNRYLATMVRTVQEFNGTIDDFIGDAIFVIFGAPTWQEDDAQRACACAIAMQVAMASVNEQNAAEGLPVVEMGIGLHTGPVVVGNIGSPERMKYDVIGSHVNLTSRIQSYTTGGQILISDETRHEVGHMLSVGVQTEVHPKGIEHPIMVYELRGIGGRYKLYLPQTAEPLISLAEELDFRYAILDGANAGGESFKGTFSRLSSREAEASLEQAVPILSDLKITLKGTDGQAIVGALYGKVVGTLAGSSMGRCIRFTSMSPEIGAFLTTRRKAIPLRLVS